MVDLNKRNSICAKCGHSFQCQVSEIKCPHCGMPFTASETPWSCIHRTEAIVRVLLATVLLSAVGIGVAGWLITPHTSNRANTAKSLGIDLLWASTQMFSACAIISLLSIFAARRPRRNRVLWLTFVVSCIGSALFLYVGTRFID